MRTSKIVFSFFVAASCCLSSALGCAVEATEEGIDQEESTEKVLEAQTVYSGRCLVNQITLKLTGYCAVMTGASCNKGLSAACPAGADPISISGYTPMVCSHRWDNARNCTFSK